VDEIRTAITSKTKAVFCINYAGVSPQLAEIKALCEEFGLVLLEDNAHGLGAKSQGQPLGTFAALATQSFHETKNIACGEGGALLVNDDSLIERAEILREKGTNRSQFLKGQVDKYTWVDIGSSWVISDLLAAILFGQLERADEINTRRLQIWDRYHTELMQWANENKVTQPHIPKECEHVGHVYFLRFQHGEQRTRFINHMKESNISCVFHYQPLNTSPVGQKFGGFEGQCFVAEQAGECLVRLPLFNSMSDDDQTRVVEAALTFAP
jgi:dTDP-4-amino-4,6-dideoxygalactose transaminase